MDLGISGKKAIVCAASKGLGKACAISLAREGVDVTICARTPGPLEATAEEIRALGGGAVTAIACDITTDEGRDKILEQCANPDILINNAGTSVRKRPEDLTEEDWHYVLNTNLTSSFLCSKACYPEMKKAGAGKILNNGSMLSIFGSPWGAAYGASKGGIMQYTRSQAVAWGPDNIQVNCFLPGWINTKLTKSAREYAPELNDKVLSRTPAGRWGEPDDLAGLAVFMASHASDFLTGTAIPIDGGFSVAI